MGYASAEIRRQKQQEWRHRNPDRVREYERRWRLKNKDRDALNKKKYREANYERFLELKRLRYAADPQKALEKGRRWRAANREKSLLCYRNAALKRAYGMNVESRDAMFAAQGSVCAACGSSEPGSKRGWGWHIDHCHKTGVVRGILCHGCNAAAGHAKDDPVRLRMIADYLEKPLCLKSTT